MNPLLEISDLRTHFFTRAGVVHAVDGIDLSLGAGKTLGLVGESGCGKSVTALSIMGLLPKPPAKVVSGKILFDGRDLLTLSERQLEDVRGDQIGMVFQDPMTSLNPTLTIGLQMVETIRRHTGAGKDEAKRQAADLLEEVRIPNARRALKDYPHRFSGGMRQRVMIAMALSCQPRLLIADEPTTALDVTVQAQVLDLLNELRESHHMALLLITHDMGVISQAADDVAVMYAGQIVEQAPVREIFRRPEHPYTEALLGAIPVLDATDARHGRLVTIAGRPPDLLDPPAVCRFADRCPYADRNDRCTTEMPPLREVRPRHLVRSFHSATDRGAR